MARQPDGVVLTARAASAAAALQAVRDLLRHTGVPFAERGYDIASGRWWLKANPAAVRAVVASALGDAVEVQPDDGKVPQDVGPLLLPPSFAGAATHGSTPDVWDVEADSRAALLAACADILAAIKADPGGVAPETVLRVHVDLPPDATVPDADRMHAWLSQVLHVTDARRFALRRVVVLRDEPHRVAGILMGQSVNAVPKSVRGMVKAVKRAGLRVEPDGTRWRAHVELDL